MQPPPARETHYTIGQIARAAGVPSSTVRYYERMGYLQPSGRTPGNYRLYGEDALERLRFMRAAQTAGFTLADIASLLSLQNGTTTVCQRVQTLIEKRVEELTKRIAELCHLQDVLTASLEKCRQTEHQGRCVVLDHLHVTSSCA